MFSRILRGEFFYGWVIVGITVVVLIGAAGIRSAAGVMILPMQGETGWALSTISLSVSLGLLLFGFTGPFSGALMERFGLRNMVLVGLLMIAASMIVSARMTTEWELFLFWGILSGVGSGLIGTVLGATVASRWFVANRGLVVGIFGAATSAGQLIFLPLLMQLVLSLGWRTTTFILAVIMLALLLPVFLVLRDDPAMWGCVLMVRPRTCRPRRRCPKWVCSRQCSMPHVRPNSGCWQVLFLSVALPPQV